MKKIIIILVSVILLQPLLSQHDKLQFHKAAHFPIDIQVYLIKEFILQRYGSEFIYYNELKTGKYILELLNKAEPIKTNSKFCYLNIKEILNNKIIDKIKKCYLLNKNSNK